MCLVTGSLDLSNLTKMQGSKIIILGASSDIGAHLAEYFLSNGAEIIATYRNRTPRVVELEKMGIKMICLDITSSRQISSFVDDLSSSGFVWDTLISAVGLLNPIGPFFSSNFDDWENSLVINSSAQLRVLHEVFSMRDQSGLSKVLFFAGGGTNGPFENSTAYCLGKLALIKMTELLDSECPDVQISIIGTGWVNTKIHRQTIAAGEAAGSNFDKTRQFIANSGNVGSSLETVAECVDWCLSAPRDAVGGRNFSLVHDPWRDPRFIDELIANPDSYKLRRPS